MHLPPGLPAQLTDHYAALIARPVDWGDMDAANHVNNTVYIQWAETARIGYWQLGRLPMQQDQGPVVARISAKYIFPVQFPDTIWMGTRFLHMKGDMFFLESLMVSEKHQKVACIVETCGVMFDYSLQKKADPIPEMATIFRETDAQYLGKTVEKEF